MGYISGDGKCVHNFKMDYESFPSFGFSTVGYVKLESSLNRRGLWRCLRVHSPSPSLSPLHFPSPSLSHPSPLPKPSSPSSPHLHRPLAVAIFSKFPDKHVRRLSKTFNQSCHVWSLCIQIEKKNVNDAVIVIVVVIVIVIFIVAFIVIVMCDQEPFLTQCLFLPFQVSPHFSKSAHLRLLH